MTVLFILAGVFFFFSLFSTFTAGDMLGTGDAQIIAVNGRERFFRQISIALKAIGLTTIFFVAGAIAHGNNTFIVMSPLIPILLASVLCTLSMIFHSKRKKK